MISKFQPFEYYRKKDKFASFQNLWSKDFARASRFHIWLTAAKTQKTRRVVSSAGHLILKIGVSLVLASDASISTTTCFKNIEGMHIEVRHYQEDLWKKQVLWKQ